MTELRDRVLRVYGLDSLKECIRLFKAREITQVFLDVTFFEINQIQNIARQLQRNIAENCSVFEPVVVGPITNGQLLDKLGYSKIRATDLTFEEYCQDLQNKRNRLKEKNKNEYHRLDTEEQIFFYENDFYVFSNFSSFAIEKYGKIWPTSEHLYHAEKFSNEAIREQIRNARSAHDSFKIAQENKDKYRCNWDDVKLDIMKDILWDKVNQHSYVKKKLLDSGNRELIEDSWRDDFWGWGKIETERIIWADCGWRFAVN